jgi:hypothetical protein
VSASAGPAASRPAARVENVAAKKTDNFILTP